MSKQKAKKLGSRGGQVTAARNRFVERYGTVTYDCVRYLVTGRDTNEVADIVGVSTRTVGTTKANLTRGVYDSFLDECNFTRRSVSREDNRSARLWG